jgi:hypothetical protein
MIACSIDVIKIVIDMHCCRVVAAILAYATSAVAFSVAYHSNAKEASAALPDIFKISW